MPISKKEWQEFVEWCSKRWPLWSPHSNSVEVWEEWKAEKLKKEKEKK